MAGNFTMSLLVSYTFHPISAKIYEVTGYHDGIQAITFIGNKGLLCVAAIESPLSYSLEFPR